MPKGGRGDAFHTRCVKQGGEVMSRPAPMSSRQERNEFLVYVRESVGWVLLRKQASQLFYSKGKVVSKTERGERQKRREDVTQL